ncbi:MAG TPA: terminase gpA endonuclease subunit, partial [Phycisphaerae bacterium]|nr:terminase gpA endonuclease subunit [Phycisphaerae bacterium]
ETQKTLNGEWGVPEGPVERADEHTRDRDRKRRQRGAERDITIPEIKDLKRRHACARNPPRWLKTYFPDTFYLPFVKNQKDMIRTTLERVRLGGTKANAYPRMEGKTTIAKGVIMLCICEGWLRFAVLIGKNATEARRNQLDIQFYFERNDLLAEDYPEVCFPIRELHGASQRAKSQTFDGKPTGLRWSGEFLRFAEIPGSKAAGSLLCAKGIDSPIAGLNFQGLRPDFVLVDDIEDRSTVKSPKETEDRRIVLVNEVVPLGGIDKTIGVQLNCTIRKRGCIADEFTDRKLRPAWHGTRARQLERRPSRMDLWDQYIQLRQQDHFNADATGRTAAAFYRKHRKQMDAAGRVANKYRFTDAKCPDGTRLETSALQHCFNTVADHGWEHFNTEYQNDPPEADPDATRIDMADIQRKLNGLPPATVPPWAETLTAFIDVHGFHLDYAVVASRQGFASAVVDYDVADVYSPRRGRLTDAENVEAVDNAILTALLTWREREREYGWPAFETGEIRHADRVLIDTRWRPDPVCEFVRSNPGGQYRAAMGCGIAEARKFRMPTKRTKDRKIGFHYFAIFSPEKRLWVFETDADYWKRFVHDSLAGAPDWSSDTDAAAEPKRGGILTLFGDDPHAHRAYAEQILAERWENGKWVGPTGKEPGKNNHFLDATAGALAAAAMQGIRPIGSAAPDAPPAHQRALPAAADAGGYKPRKPGAPGSGYKIGR